MEIIYLAIGIIIGTIIGGLFASRKAGIPRQEFDILARQEITAQEKARSLLEQLSTANSELEKNKTEVLNLNRALAEKQAQVSPLESSNKQVERDKTKGEHDQKKAAIENSNNEISSECTKIAKNVKSSFGLIQTKNSKFLNYDKRKLETFLSGSKDKIKSENILSAEAIEKNKFAAQATQKVPLNEMLWLFDINNIKSVVLKSKEIAEKSIVAAQIQRLASSQELNKWVETGLDIHKKTSRDICEFCGSSLSADRIKELEAHFSNEYQVLLSDVSTALVDVSAISKNLEFVFPDSGGFYAEFQVSLKKIKEDADSKKGEIKYKLSKLLQNIEEKKFNPFQVIQWEQLNLKDDFDSLEQEVKKFNQLVQEHNKKTSDFGFIQQHLGEAKQLFILTHNFEFFKLVRNWLKNKNLPNKNGVVSQKSRFYLIQSKLEEARTSEIISLPAHLLNYESEYHFLFEKVLSFKDDAKPSFEKAHFIGNGSRKILEAFLAFKYPAHRGDFAGLLKKGCDKDTNTFQKVFSFINRYSHSQTLEVFESGTDNLFSESQNIVTDVFQIIKKLDQSHYEEMEKLCS